MHLIHKWSPWAHCQSSHPSEFFHSEHVYNWDQRSCTESNCDYIQIRKTPKDSPITRKMG